MAFLKTSSGRFSLLPSFRRSKALLPRRPILSSCTATLSTMMTHGHFADAQDHPDPVKSRERQIQLLDREHMILVDEHDQYRGVASKRECHTWAKIEPGADMLHRAFSVFLFNSADELLMQKRAADKVTFPGLWSNTCCSHPLHDLPEEMTSDWPDFTGAKRAARRKLIHELNMDESLEKFCFVGRILYKARSGTSEWGEHELDHIFFVRADGALPGQAPNREEVERVQFVSREKLTALMMTTGHSSNNVEDEEYRFTPWFRMISREFLLNDWWNKIDSFGGSSKSADKAIHKL